MTSRKAKGAPLDADRDGRSPAAARAWWPWAVLAAAVLAFLWDQFLLGRVFLLRDVVGDSLPWRRFAADALRDGTIPLWNALSRFGQPFLANPQSAVLYPPHLLFVVLPAGFALKLNIALHLFVAAGSTYALLRDWALARPAALLGALAYAFGAYMAVNLEFMSVMESLAWSPLTVLLLGRLAGGGPVPAASRPRLVPWLRLVSLLALVIAVQFLAGQPQPLLHTLLIGAVYGLALASRGGARRVGTFVAGSLAAVLLGLGLAMPQLLPTWELVPHSIRAGGVDPGLAIASLHPSQLAGALLPFSCGRPGEDAWAATNLLEFWLGAFHVGLAPLLLATACLLGPRSTRPRILAAGSGVVIAVGVVLALGRYTPVYGALLETLPGFDFLRWPAKSLQLVVFGLVVLAALGLDAALRRRHAMAESGAPFPVALVGAWVAAWGALFAGWFVLDASDLVPPGRVPAEAATAALAASFGPDYAYMLALLALSIVAATLLFVRRMPVAVGVAALLLLTFGNLYHVSREILASGDDALLAAGPRGAPLPIDPAARVHTPYSFAQFALYGSRESDDFRRAIDVLAGDTGLSHGVGRTYGGDALQLRNAQSAVELLDALPPRDASRLADVLTVRWVLDGPPFDEIRALPDWSGPRWVERPGALPRAYLVGRWETAATWDEALGRVLAPGFDPRGCALVDTDSGAAPPPGNDAPAAVAGAVTDADYGVNEVRLEVEAQRRALLVLCDTWHPGWIAEVDGRAQPLHRVNGLFRGVVLAPGRHAVRFVYAPGSFRWGLVVGGLSLLVALSMLALARRRVSAD